MKINNTTMPKKEIILSSCINHKAKLDGKIPVEIEITEWKKNEFSANISFEIEGEDFDINCPKFFGGRTTKLRIISMVNKFLKVLGYTGEEVKA